MFKVHHIALSVKNIENTFSFYNIFGFEKKFYWQSEDKSLEIMHIKLGEFFLELFCFKNNTKLPETAQKIETDLPVIGVKHFGLQVENIDQTKQKLEKLGISENIKITKGRTDIKYFFIKDPDGILLEIVEDKRDL